MIDILPELYGWLKPICRVELQFPSGVPKLPLITVTDLGSASSVILGGKERICAVEFQIDVWTRSAKECAELAAKANNIIIGRGFTRYFAGFLFDPAAPARKCLRYRGEIDEKTLWVYR